MGKSGLFDWGEMAKLPNLPRSPLSHAREVQQVSPILEKPIHTSPLSHAREVQP
jgi:hypothetical protein